MKPYNPPSNDAYDLLKKLNFIPPCPTWTFPDQRGKEYGIWHASPAYGHNGAFITATFKPGDPTSPVFTLNFATPADFERWAKHTL